MQGPNHDFRKHTFLNVISESINPCIIWTTIYLCIIHLLFPYSQKPNLFLTIYWPIHTLYSKLAPKNRIKLWGFQQWEMRKCCLPVRNIALVSKSVWPSLVPNHYQNYIKLFEETELDYDCFYQKHEWEIWRLF